MKMDNTRSTRKTDRMDDKASTILDYLASKREEDELFVTRSLAGDCYKLARELTGLFGGVVYACNEDNHATAKICGNMFDATGLISKKRAGEYHEMSEEEHAEAATWKY